MQKKACAALASALLLGSFSIPSLASGTEQLAAFLKGTHSASGSFSQVTSSPAAILFGNNDFRRDFTVKDAGTKDGLEWIDAVPKLHDTSFTDIRIGFRDGLPAAMTLKDSFGQTITLHMSDMKKNPSISSSAFEFRPPKGAEILRQ